MSLSEFGESTNNVSALPDKPAMSSAELKRTFDKAGTDIKGYLNNTLTKELDTALGRKVDKETGKSLISAEERTKLNGIEEGANRTVIASGTAEPTASTNADIYIQILE